MESAGQKWKRENNFVDVKDSLLQLSKLDKTPSILMSIQKYISTHLRLEWNTSFWAVLMMEEFEEFLSYCWVPWRTLFWVNLTEAGQELARNAVAQSQAERDRDASVKRQPGQRTEDTGSLVPPQQITTRLRLDMNQEDTTVIWQRISNIPTETLHVSTQHSCTSVIILLRWLSSLSLSEPRCPSSVGSEDLSDEKKRVTASTAGMSLKTAITAKIFMKTLSLTTRMTYWNGWTWILVMAMASTTIQSDSNTRWPV